MGLGNKTMQTSHAHAEASQANLIYENTLWLLPKANASRWLCDGWCWQISVQTKTSAIAQNLKHLANPEGVFAKLTRRSVRGMYL